MSFYVFCQPKTNNKEQSAWEFISMCDELEQTKPYLKKSEQRIYRVFEYTPEVLSTSPDQRQ